MKVVLYLLASYIITKPFYLWSSGLPQISDFVLLVAFMIILFVVDKKTIYQVVKENKLFFLFLLFVVIINVFYSIYYGENDFLLHMLYYIFDALGIIVFVVTYKKIDTSKRILSNSFKISILIQFLIFFLQIGRYYLSTRYMGTFNDPNQFAYYCFLSFGFIYLLDLGNSKKRKVDILFLFISLILIYNSASAGMLFGMGIFIILYLIPLVKKLLINLRRYSIFLALLSLCLAVGFLSFFVFEEEIHFDLFDNIAISRVQNKLNNATGNNSITLWEERGYDRFYHYPYYSIFGFGEGAYWRLEKTYHQNELHGTIPSILFCYGFVPTVFITIWFIKKLKKQRWETMCIYLALLLESFTLINSRQVLFWVIFAIAPYIVVRKELEESAMKS